MSNWLYIIISFQLNEKPVGFKTDHLDLTYLIKDKYDKDMDKLLNQDTPVVNLSDVKQGECNSFYERRMFQSQWGPAMSPQSWSFWWNLDLLYDQLRRFNIIFK